MAGRAGSATMSTTHEGLLRAASRDASFFGRIRHARDRGKGLDVIDAIIKEWREIQRRPRRQSGGRP